MIRTTEPLWDRIKPLLSEIERPVRYLDHELNATTGQNVLVTPGLIRGLSGDVQDASVCCPENWSSDGNQKDRPAIGEAQTSGLTDIAFVYPDSYEIGQSNQAIAILYDIVRRLPGVNVERAFLPWVDMIVRLRELEIPLFTLESCRELAAFNLIGVTMPHELSYTNILELLDLAGIPLYAAERFEKDPLIIGGGPCAFNPEPIAPFFDAICIGEGEEVIVELIKAYQQAKACGAPRVEILRSFAAIDGVYVPCLNEARHVSPTVAPDFQNVAPDFQTVAPDFQNVAPDLIWGLEGDQQEDCVCPAETPSSVEIPSQIHQAAGNIITKRIIADLDALPVVQQPIVPYAELTHDRLNIEILRGCTRGCRFCQAGMIYRPVRERSADTIVRAVVEGLACTGYDEVSLTSLSSTDHSQIVEILHRLNHSLEGTGTRLSLPSQRLDAFGVEMARLVAGGERKTGLTFAPEAGTQRLRDIINKNVTERDLIDAVSCAFAAGWRRCKLYFMIGLPGETDEDIRGIVELSNRAYQAAKDAVPNEQRNNCRMGVSVAVFIPKAHTPFQWCGMVSNAEIQRRISVLRGARLHRGIDLHWHDPTTSLIEAVMSRGGRELACLVELAWRKGARFDAWTEQFNKTAWQEAAFELGIDLEAAAMHEFGFADALPWDHISCGVNRDYLADEYEKALAAVTTPDCSFGHCTSCGVCSECKAQIRLGGSSRG